MEGVVKGIVEDDNGLWVVIATHPMTGKQGRILPQWILRDT